ALRAVFSEDWDTGGPATSSCGGAPAWGLQLEAGEALALAAAQRICGSDSSWAEAAGAARGIAAAAACGVGRDGRSGTAVPRNPGGGGADGGGPGGSGLGAGGLPLLSGTVRRYGGTAVALRFSLPRGYPADPEQPPLLAVECAGPRQVHDRLSGAVQAAVYAGAGCECLLLAVDALRDAVGELPVGLDADDGAGAAAAAGAPAAAEGLLCVLVWLHHLKSLAKRKLIVQWARELSLAGACKPGFPGVVIVEGHSSDVAEFLARMRALTWQAMQVRGQDLLPLSGPGSGPLHQAAADSARGGPAAHGLSGSSSSSGRGGCGGGGAAGGGRGCPAGAGGVEAVRRLRGPFLELAEGGMSELGVMCRAAGLHHVFLTALKL
ncbi:RWD domain-containing protein 2B, partial [Tetrabaena socialis]